MRKTQKTPTIAKAITHYLLMLSHFPSKRLLASRKPPLFAFIAEHNVIWQEISFWMVEVISPSIVYPPVYSLEWGTLRTRESLDAVQTLLEN